jgi:hypothetical protein
MITKAEIDALAVQIAEPDNFHRHVPIIERLLGLSKSEQDAVLERAEAIEAQKWEALACERAEELKQRRAEIARLKAELQAPWEALLRLARAAGCPGDAPVIPWLAERGLIEETKGGEGWRFKAAKPGAVG